MASYGYNQSKAKTKKKKTFLSRKEKEQLWSVFDENISTEPETKDEPKNSSLNSHCIYDAGENMSEKVNEETSSFTLCNQCQSPLMIMEDGFPTCTSKRCGIMYTDTLDYSPEWRFYGAEDKNSNDPTRCGNPINPLLKESSYGCKILCAPNASFEMRRLRKWTEWQAMPHREKSLYEEFQFITNMARNAGINKIFIDDAMAIHKDISEQQMFRGINRDGIKAASIYLSCRLNNCPRTSHEIAEIFKLDKTSATNGCSVAVNILCNIDRNNDSGLSQSDKLCTSNPSAFIERYCSQLHMPSELIKLANFIAMKIEKEDYINDNTPQSVAAGIIYFVAQTCHLNFSKGDVRNVANVSEVTINKCFKKIDMLREKLVPSCILEKYTQ
jgi:transcription initiation factor TFIIB